MIGDERGIGGDRLGRCLNTGRCGLADAGEAIPIAPAAAFECPECGRALVAFGLKDRRATPGQDAGGPLPWRLVALGIFVMAMIAIGIAYGLFAGSGRSEAKEVISPFGGMSRTILRVGDPDGAGDGLARALVSEYLRQRGCRGTQVRADTANRIVFGCSIGLDAVNIQVAPPGSIAARAGLSLGAVDVALMTRPMSDREAARLRSHGNVFAWQNARVAGIDAVAIIVHPSNPLVRLTPAQVIAVFTGAVGDFSDVGGRAGPIRVIVPAPGSPGERPMMALVSGGSSPAGAARSFASAAEIAAAVADDPAAIGVVDPSMLLGARAVPIGPADGIASLPTPLAIASGDYALQRPLYLYRSPAEKTTDAARFMAFAMSATGQEIIARAGLLPLVIRRYRDPLPPGAPPEYVGLVMDADRLSANFRFRRQDDGRGSESGGESGSDFGGDFESRSVADLDRVAAQMLGERVTADRIMLIGFDDTPREAGMDMTRSIALARQVATALAERGLRVGVVRGFGGALPVASNAEVEGRNYNRRVEVWVRR